MNEADLTEFTEILTTLCLLYKTSVSEKLVDLYWDALACFDWQTVKAAFQWHLCNPDVGQLMPKPANVICAIRGSSPSQALQAWSQVSRAIRMVGSYDSVVFDDAVIHAVIDDMGGWISFCHTSLKELPFRAKEFEKRYAGYVHHPPPYYPSHLIGLEEQHNRLHHQPTKLPVLIGDPERALVVLQHGSEQLLTVQPAPLLSTLANPHLSTMGDIPS